MDRPMKILLVEDTPSDIRLAQEALKDTGINHELTIVNDGVAAMETLMKGVDDETARPDLILLDLNMPKKNGHEVLADLKKTPGLDQIPVILMTVSQDEQDILKALHLKMNYYAGKPITSEKLAVLLHAIQDLWQSAEKLTADGLTGEDAHVRYVMAGNPHTSPEILVRLASESKSQIRMRVAENPKTPLSALWSLARDFENEVRLAVAENPNAPINLLEELARDPNDDVRLELATNMQLPTSVLSILAEDENLYVVDKARKTLAALAAPAS